MTDKTKSNKIQRSVHDLLMIPPGEYAKTILGEEYKCKKSEPKQNIYLNSIYNSSNKA